MYGTFTKSIENQQRKANYTIFFFHLESQQPHHAWHNNVNTGKTIIKLHIGEEVDVMPVTKVFLSYLLLEW